MAVLMTRGSLLPIYRMRSRRLMSFWLEGQVWEWELVVVDWHFMWLYFGCIFCFWFCGILDPDSRELGRDLPQDAVMLLLLVCCACIFLMVALLLSRPRAPRWGRGQTVLGQLREESPGFWCGWAIARSCHATVGNLLVLYGRGHACHCFLLCQLWAAGHWGGG
jgi:hypothetical protein